MTMPTGDAQTSPPTRPTPAPPLPHAAPAPAAEAGEIEAKLTVALTLAMVERVRRASAVQVRKDALDLIEDWNILNLANAKLRDRAEAAEAERDRLSAELAAVRGAMPDTLTLAMIASRIEHQCADDDDAAVLRRMLAALATAPTPPAAGAGTGGEAWTRGARRGQSGLYWLLFSGEDRPRLLDVFWPSDGPVVASIGAPRPGEILLWGPPFTGDPPDGWREALAALDTPQEADHAAR